MSASSPSKSGEFGCSSADPPVYFSEVFTKFHGQESASRVDSDCFDSLVPHVALDGPFFIPHIDPDVSDVVSNSSNEDHISIVIMVCWSRGGSVASPHCSPASTYASIEEVSTVTKGVSTLLVNLLQLALLLPQRTLLHKQGGLFFG